MKEGKIQLDVGAVNQPRTLFKPGSWLAKIDFINHLILFNNVLITVLSEKEGGKTSFSNLLQNNLDQQIKSVSLTVKAPCDTDSIINDIAAQLHLNNDANTDVGSLIAQVNERKAHVLLVIDDAQHLSESFIKEIMIAIKNQDNFGFFHLCLVSDYSLVATLNGLAVEQFNNLIHTIELGSLNESETRTYVLQRAMTARLINRPLTDAQFKQFYQSTKGSVSKINANLETFIFKCSTQKKNNNIFSLKKVSAAVAATVVAGFSYMYFDSMYKYEPTEHLSAATEAEVALALKQVNFELAQTVELDSKIAPWQDSSTHELVQVNLPKPQVLGDSANSNLAVDPSIVALAEKVATLPAIEAAPPTVQESKLVEVQGFSKNKEDIQPIAVIGNSASRKFTIQLVASHNVDDVHRFRKNNNLHNITTLRHFTNEKGHWYILTVGEYNSLDKAQLKASKLPAELAKLNPWIRSTNGLTNIG